MTLWERWRRDLARPERRRCSADLPYLFASPVIIVIVAQLTDPGTAAQVAIIGLAVLGYVAWGLLPGLPAEVFAVLVLVPVAVVVGDDGRLEGTFFLVVTMVLYTSWHLGSLTRALHHDGVGRCSRGWWRRTGSRRRDQLDGVGDGQRVHVRAGPAARPPAS